MKKNSLLKAMLIAFLVYVVLSWIIPVGYYSNGEFVKETMLPIGLLDVIIYPLITGTSSLFILVAINFLLIGGMYSVLNKTGAYGNLLDMLVKKFKGREKTVLVVVTLLFVILSSLTGLSLPLFVFVPLAATLLMLLGFSKFDAMLSTVGGILVGNMASTYGFNVAGYISKLTNNVNDSIWVRILILVLVTGVLLYTLLTTSRVNKGKNKETNIPLYEGNVDKKSKVTSLVVFLIISLIVLLVGMFNWYEVFGIKIFNDMYDGIINFEFVGYPIFKNILGSIPAIGAWTNYEVGLVIIITTFIIGKVYGLKLSEMVESFIEGMKKMLPVAVWTVAANLLFLLLNTNSNGYTFFNTISNFILNLSNGLNVVTLGFTSLIGSVLYNDFPYLLSVLYAPVTTLYQNYSMIGIVTQSIHGLVQIIAPTSVILVAGLAFFNIEYSEWLKKLWKFFLGLLAVVIIAMIVMIFIA